MLPNAASRGTDRADEDKASPKGCDTASHAPSSATTVCERCGNALQVGEWPFCGGKNNHGFPLNGLSIIDDQLEGGPRRFETMGPAAPYIETKSQWRREMDKRGLINVSRHDAAYYVKQRKEHDERLRDTGDPYPETERKPVVTPRYVRGRV